MKNQRIVLKKDNAKHLYIAQVQINGIEVNVDVYANNRTQAGSMVRAAGYEVRSMFMEG